MPRAHDRTPALEKTASGTDEDSDKDFNWKSDSLFQ